MKIIIDIPEEVIKDRKYSGYFGCLSSKLVEVIDNAAVLPEGHGDLIDRDELKQHICGGDYDGCGGFTPEYILLSDINDAPVIIPAARITESSETMGDL